MIKRKTSDLIPYINNSRTHSDEQVTQIASSISEFGFINPIIVDGDNGIIAGHGRLLAAIKLGIEEIPIVEVSHLTEAQKKAYIIADNNLALNAGWDEDLLKIEIEGLQELDFDIDLLGFDGDFIDGLLDEPVEGLTDEDAIPETPEQPITKRGDVWVLGNHRVMCGDSTMIDDVDVLMDGNKVALLFTSPPYSDMREYNGGKNLSVDSLSEFIRVYSDVAKYQIINLGLQRRDNEIFDYWSQYIEKAKINGYLFLSWNVWDKGEACSVGNQTAMFPIEHEWIFVFGKEKLKINKTIECKYGDKFSRSNSIRNKDGTTTKTKDILVSSKKPMGTVYKTGALKARRTGIDHPAAFTIEFPEGYILSMTKTNNNVCDPFGGSGSTLIACEKTNRNCYMMELDEKYCDVIIKRWMDYTGKIAILESSGQEFKEVA